jgi:hypothetical protein
MAANYERIYYHLAKTWRAGDQHRSARPARDNPLTGAAARQWHAMLRAKSLIAGKDDEPAVT